MDHGAVAQALAADPVLVNNEKRVLTTDLAGGLRTRAAGGAIFIVAGNQTPGDSVVTPTDAVDTRTWNELFSDAANRSFLWRGAAWTAAVATRAASVFAGDVNAQVWGPNGLGGISSQRITATGQTLATFAPNGPFTPSQANFGAQALETVLNLPMYRAQSALIGAFTDGNWAPPTMSLRGDTFQLPGRPVANARNNPDQISAGQQVYGSGADNSVVNAPCLLKYFKVWNLDDTATVFAQLHLTNAAIVAGAVPLWSIPLGGIAPGAAAAPPGFPPDFAMAWDDGSGGGGLFCTPGAHIGFSSTRDTYTAAITAAHAIWMYYQ